MLTPEDMQLLSELMDKKLEPINTKLDKIEERLDNVEERLDNVEERLDSIEENTEITRAVANELVEWVDFNFHKEYPFPVKKIEVI